MEESSIKYEQTKVNNTLKRSHSVTKRDSFQEHKDDLSPTNVIHYISKMKDKNPMIIKVDKKHLTKFNIHLWLKTLNKVCIEEIYLNMIKAIYDKPTANIILNGEKLKAFPLDQEQYKDAHCQQFYSIWYWKS